jgi:hypothetical protein
MNGPAQNQMRAIDASAGAQYEQGYPVVIWPAGLQPRKTNS